MLKILIEVVGIMLMVMVVTLSVSLLHLAGATGIWMVIGMIPCTAIAFGTYLVITGDIK